MCFSGSGSGRIKQCCFGPATQRAMALRRAGGVTGCLTGVQRERDGARHDGHGEYGRWRGHSESGGVRAQLTGVDNELAEAHSGAGSDGRRCSATRVWLPTGLAGAQLRAGVAQCGRW